MMRNSASLPIAALLVAAGLIVLLLVSTGDGQRIPLTELELGGVAAVISLLIFGIQGLISVALEGEQLLPGRHGPRLTDPISAAIILFSLLLFGIAVALAYGIVNEWQVRALGVLSGIGSTTLALLLVLYKEAFIGDEARFDDRQDGVPW